MDASAPIFVSLHAERRLVARDPRVGDRPRDVILGDVRAALQAGRVARHLPTWCRNNRNHGTAKKPNRGEGIMRFVWTEDERRAYVVSWNRDRKGVRDSKGRSRCWIVVTTIAR